MNEQILVLFSIVAAAILGFLATAAIFWRQRPKEKGLFPAVWIMATLACWGGIIRYLSD